MLCAHDLPGVVEPDVDVIVLWESPVPPDSNEAFPPIMVRLDGKYRVSMMRRDGRICSFPVIDPDALAANPATHVGDSCTPDYPPTQFPARDQATA
jgi:hypothetical protein